MNIKIIALEYLHFVQWLPLWEDYLNFYQVQINQQNIQLTWQRLIDVNQKDLFGYAILVESQATGFVHLNVLTSTWSEKPYCYLQDLYIDKNFRNRGLAQKLIEHCYKNGRGKFAQIYWITDQSNTTAQRLYDRLATKTDFIQYKKML